MLYVVNLNSGPKESGFIKRGSIKVARLTGGSIKRGLLYFEFSCYFFFAEEKEWK